MAKNIIVKPNANLLLKYFLKYGYWANFCFDYFPETFASQATTESINADGFQLNSNDYNKVKQLLNKFNISNTEITDNLSIIVLIIKSTVKDLGEYSWANQLHATQHYVAELEQIKELISKHEQFITLIHNDIGQREVKNYLSEFDAKINLTYKNKVYKFNFTDGNIRMALFRALEEHLKQNNFLINLYKNDTNYPTIKDLTKQNKINTPKSDNVLLTHKRRIAKATNDFLSEFKLNPTQNKKCILIGRLFELGELIESEIDFNKNIAPSTNYKAIGLRSKSSPYEKFLQQRIKKFIKEFEPT